jgi:hypothetical protein
MRSAIERPIRTSPLYSLADRAAAELWSIQMEAYGGPAQTALLAEFAAAKALIATAPTTRAGLRALAAHLREDDSFLALRFIQHPQTLEWCEKFGKLTAEARDRDLVDWLIAQRAAELAA